MPTFYSQSGAAVAYLDNDGKSIYLYAGAPVAYLSGDTVYSYGGRVLGWLDSGWVIDRSGLHVFFTEKARGGPMKPMKNMKPMKGMKGMKPMKGMKEMTPMRPMRSLAWSQLSGPAFFHQ